MARIRLPADGRGFLLTQKVRRPAAATCWSFGADSTSAATCAPAITFPSQTARAQRRALSSHRGRRRRAQAQGAGGEAVAKATASRLQRRDWVRIRRPNGPKKGKSQPEGWRLRGKKAGNVLLSHSVRCSTIGANGFDCRVRDGIGSGTVAMVTGKVVTISCVSLVLRDPDCKPWDRRGVLEL